jgi:hypothetical protein
MFYRRGSNGLNINIQYKGYEIRTGLHEQQE